MSKNVLFSLIFIVSFSCIWAVWEGNGGIGVSTDFPPEGLFVRSDMFPKHTLLEITNLEKNISIRAVVIGPAGIPGLLVSLSPELGEKLLVPKGKVIRMRVLTPSPVQEIGDDGTSILGTSPESKDLDSNPALFVASHTNPPDARIKTNLKNKPIVKNNTDDTILYDEFTQSTTVKDKNSIETTPILINTTTEFEKTEDLTKKEDISKPAINPEHPISETTSVVKPIETTPPERDKKPVEIKPITEIHMEPANEKPPVTVSPINEPKPIEENILEPVKEIQSPVPPTNTEEEQNPVEEVPPPIQPVLPEEKSQEPVQEVESPMEPETPTEEPQEPVQEVESPMEPETPTEEPQEPVQEVESPNKPSTPDEASKSVDIVEVISEPENPPATDENEIESIAEIKSDSKAEPINPPVDPIPQEEEISPKKVDSNDIYTVTEEAAPIEKETPRISSKLEKGKDYVQIVMFNDKYNCDEVAKNYGKTYPLVIEESYVINKKRYTLFIGPLKADETGAVIERFRQLGFKDAFLKKIR